MASLTKEINVSAERLAAAYGAAIRKLTSTVTLVTTCTEYGDWRGVATVGVTSISMAPPTAVVCIDRSSSIHPALLTSKKLCINAMHNDNHSIIGSFTKPQQKKDRFQVGRWQIGRDGIPYLVGAQSNIFAEIFKMIGTRTHDVVFANVVEVINRSDVAPLLHAENSYFTASDRSAND